MERMIDGNSDSPLVLIPGIQGRWEWMEPAVDALGAAVPRHHVLARG